MSYRVGPRLVSADITGGFASGNIGGGPGTRVRWALVPGNIPQIT